MDVDDLAVFVDATPNGTGVRADRAGSALHTRCLFYIGGVLRDLDVDLLIIVLLPRVIQLLVVDADVDHFSRNSFINLCRSDLFLAIKRLQRYTAHRLPHTHSEVLFNRCCRADADLMWHYKDNLI